MRLLTCLLLSSLLACGAAYAKDAPRDPVGDALSAYKAGDLERLAKLAAKDDPDPWHVADHLCKRGEHEAAMAFARAASRQDTARLPAYLETRRGRPHDAKLRAALWAGRRARDEAQSKAALARLDEHEGRGDAFERAMVQLERGNLLSDLDEHAAAYEAFLASGKLAEDLGWLSVAAEAYRVAGHKARRDQNFDGAVTAWTRFQAVEEGRGNRASAAEGLMLIGNVLCELGNLEQGRQHLQDAYETFKEIGSDNGAAWVLSNLALVYARRGERQKQKHALERSLELGRKVENRIRIATVLSSLGTLHQDLGDYDRALEFHAASLALFMELDRPAGVAQETGNLGNTYSRLRRHEEAIPRLERALASFQELDEKGFVATALIGLGFAHFRNGDLDRAEELLAQGITASRDARSPWNEAHALQSYAEVLLHKKKFKESAKALADSQVIAARIDSHSTLMIGYRVQAELLMAQEKYGRAFAASQRAIENSLTLLAGLGQGEGSVARDALTAIYEGATAAATRWDKPGALFTAMEQSRAGALLESLENRAEIRAAAIPPALVTLEKESRARVGEAVADYQRAVAHGDLPEIRKRKAALDRTRGQLHRVIERVQSEAKAAAQVLYPVAISMEDFRRTLSPDEVYLAYSLFGEQATALVVGPKEARIVPLGPPQVIEDVARRPLNAPDQDPAPAIAALRTLLIAPLGLPKAKRILVSPHGILGYVPFALLMQQHEIAYVPSAGAFRVLESAGAERGRGVLALGDPDYKLTTVDAPKIAQRGGMHLVPLPATREEALAIGDVTLLGKDATRGRFLLSVKSRTRWRAVHLACHGLVNADRPMESALALAFDKDGRNLLTCGDVFHGRIPADLAVLSACETGKGRISRAEGIVGLTQAFMLAGAPRVIVSLWKVDDKATQALMIKFYELWNPRARPEDPERAQRVEGPKPMSAAAALKAAQEHVRGQKGWAHPYYWAAWVLWGLPD